MPEFNAPDLNISIPIPSLRNLRMGTKPSQSESHSTTTTIKLWSSKTHVPDFRRLKIAEFLHLNRYPTNENLTISAPNRHKFYKS